MRRSALVLILCGLALMACGPSERRTENWDITAITEEDGPDPTAMIVSIDIDGKPYRMRVTTDEPIEWVR
jgi:hypothetical protein